jgi:hypothetical protein
MNNKGVNMRPVYFTAIKVGAVGAVLLLAQFILSSWGVNNVFDYYAHHLEIAVHDIGLFEAMLFILTSILLVISVGPVAVMVVCRNVANVREAGWVSFFACTALILASLISIMVYMSILTTIHAYPYFYDFIIRQSPLITGTAYLIILFAVMIISILCGCLIFES